MTFPPVRKFVGTLGLLGLIPTAAMLIRGDIAPLDAAVRALATFVIAMIVARGVSSYLISLARAQAQAKVTATAAAVQAARPTPLRRATDAPAEAD